MELLISCPCCESTIPFSRVRDCIDYTVTKEVFLIVECQKCLHQFTNPRPASEELGRYYESKEYISHSNSNKGIFNKIYQIVRKKALKNKLKLLSSLNCAEKKLLDIGSGTGAFLSFMKENGWVTKGIEPSETARSISIKEYNLDVSDENRLNQIVADSIDVITMWHVLEHVGGLRERIKQIHSILKSGGYIIIAVPNPSSWDAAHYESKWAAYDVPRHLHHFKPEVLKNLFTDFQLQHIQSVPMKFDSYYVSMLSEKYSKSTFWFAKGIINGLRSNLNAGNAEKYSSVIYIFKKN